MSRIRNLLFIFFFLVSWGLFSQECSFTITGKVLDEESQSPLEFVDIFMTDQELGSVSDSLGNFVLKGVCPGEHHIEFSHIGCETQLVYLTVSSDTSIFITLQHDVRVLEGVVIEGKRNNAVNLETEKINQQVIRSLSYKNLSNILESINGVRTLTNGSSLAKPIVQGLFANRVSILNNGITQSGQQWGTDHSPELDATSANRITLLSMPEGLKYIGAHNGRFLLVEPAELSNDPHLHGKLSYFFNTNGRAHTAVSQLYKGTENYSWRFTGTAKKSGDRHTPNYYLTNTGNSELNASFHLKNRINDKFSLFTYLSTFNTEIGILRGSHIGNLTDLESSFVRDTPFYTEDNFSYKIAPPKQKVQHHLLKWKALYYQSLDQWFTFTTAFQYNRRQEFDIRRGGRSDMPALDIVQGSYDYDISYHSEPNSNFKWDTGVQLRTQKNTNNPDVDILPLLPNYGDLDIGYYFSFYKRIENFSNTMSARFDYINQKVALISRDLPYRIERNNNNFYLLNIANQTTYSPTRLLTINFDLGYVSREPYINELYSYGLHQGLGRLEIGNPDLKPEYGITTGLSFHSFLFKKIHAEGSFYYKYFDNYIYQLPTGENELTIRGAFPVFTYEQTKATIYGADVVLQYLFSDKFSGQFKWNFTRGEDQNENIPLIYIPPPKLEFGLNGDFGKSNRNVHKIGWKGPKIGIDFEHIFRQNHFTINQDLLDPPSAYSLLGGSFELEYHSAKEKTWYFSIRGENILNTEYRDYLNGLRYFADDLGASVILSIGYDF